ncbi:aspartate aminotransferase-like [Plakobranchus ocellatus]|uniref:Aspartate aminotransferase-like n=1 Tax=Plakobranchus ocellatus TaxID=259542 RepID=A0AAV4BEM7_9GAST|nr:aspartate aminotransferase-like [Plakobranchus ocellatus]
MLQSQVLQNLAGCDEYIQHTNRVMRTVSEFCVRELRSVGVKVAAPQGGFYMFPNFDVIRPALESRGITTGQAMCDFILEDISVALLPGGPAHNRPAHELTARLCFVNFDGALSLAESRSRGLSKSLDDDFVKDFCAPLYGGIMVLKKWVAKLRKEQGETSLCVNGETH